MKTILVITAFIITFTFPSLTSFAQSQSREEILKAIEAKRTELVALEKQFLAPSDEDKSAYAEFLRSPDTGLIRLLPREKFDSNSRPENTKMLSTIRGGGAYYSFSRLTHDYNVGCDIELAQGTLLTGFAGADYGLLTTLGDVPLENVSLETGAARILAAYSPAPDEPHARSEQRRTSEGVTIDGVSYTRRLPLRLNSTYVLRSVVYDQSDTVVAFRVVRIDNDGSAIILWKLLKKYPKPSLARN